MSRVGCSIALCLALLWPQPATAKRVALIIGNGAYANTAKLTNPGRDAAAMEALLKTAGFDTVQRADDLGNSTLKRVLRDFSDQVRGADVAVVFYAGHGIEVNGSNYLIPVDAHLERDIDIEDETIALDRISQILDQAKGLRLIILDACRDNPFARTMKRTIGSRSIGRGLAKSEPTTADTLVAYAAKAGSTASDGNGTNSPFTTALVKHLTTPGLDVRLAFGRIRDDVLKATANRQEPAVYGSLGGSEVALVPQVAAAPTVQEQKAHTPPRVSDSTDAVRICRDVEGISSLGMLSVLERQHKGTHAGECVTARIADIKALATAKSEADRQQLAMVQKQEAAEAKRKAEEAAELKKKEAAIAIPPRAGVGQDVEQRLRAALGQSPPADAQALKLGIVAKTRLGLKSTKELNGATLCLLTGNTTERAVADYFRESNMMWKPVVFENLNQVEDAYLKGRCDGYVSDMGRLREFRARQSTPNDHDVLPF